MVDTHSVTHAEQLVKTTFKTSENLNSNIASENPKKRTFIMFKFLLSKLIKEDIFISSSHNYLLIFAVTQTGFLYLIN